MNRLLILVISALLAVSAGAETGEAKKIIWSCKKCLLGDENILWLVEWGEKSYIKVFDERIPAFYSMDGLNKRWDWGPKLETADGYDYAITLGPDRIANHYDFSNVVSGFFGELGVPLESYKCTKNQPNHKTEIRGN